MEGHSLVEFPLDIHQHDIGVCGYRILYLRQDLLEMLMTIGYSRYPDRSSLPKVVIIDLCQRYIELIPQFVFDLIQYLSLRF